MCTRNSVLFINKFQRVQISDVMKWQSVHVIASESSYEWHSLMFLVLLYSNSVYFSEIQFVCYSQTDGLTNRWMDAPSYRDARMHLKIIIPFWAVAPKGSMTNAFTYRKNKFPLSLCFLYIHCLKNSPGKWPSVRARVSQSGPGTRHQGQGPFIGAKDPGSGPGTFDQGQGPLVRARDPWSGPGTLDQGHGSLIRARDP